MEDFFFQWPTSAKKCSCTFYSHINSWRKVEFVSVAQWCTIQKVSLFFHKLDNRQGNRIQWIPSLLLLKLSKKNWPSRNAQTWWCPWDRVEWSEVGEIRGLSPNQLMILEGNLFFFLVSQNNFPIWKWERKQETKIFFLVP